MNPGIRLGDLVQRFGGRLLGDPELQVRGFASLTDAGPDQLAFLANPQYRKDVPASRAGAVLLHADDHARLDAGTGVARRYWLHEQPYLLFARVAQWLAAAAQAPLAPGIAASAVVDPSASVAASAMVAHGCVIGAGARIGARARIGAGCIIGQGVVVGEDTLLHARVVFYDACLIGARGIVHAGAVIGADGFGFARDGAAWVKIPQTGRVIIGDDVEIGANTTIDRGALADTVIANGVKLDNQIQIGHNVRIGEHSAMAGCVGIAGSSTIGRRCTVGGGAIILGHLELADDVHISAATVVTHSIKKPGHYTGFYPIGDNADWQKSAAALRRLPDMRRRLRRLEQTADPATPGQDKNSESNS